MIPNLLVDKFMRGYTTVSLLLIWEAMTLAVALIMFLSFRSRGVEMVYPEWGTMTLVILAAAVSFYFGDYFFMRAAQESLDIVTVATMIALLPIFTALTKAIIDMQLPSWRHSVAYAVVTIGIICFAWAESYKPTLAVEGQILN